MSDRCCASLPGPRVLVVDDDELVLGSIRDVLEARYAVTTTTSAREALAALERSPHEILLADLMMKELHGIELVRAAKARDPLLVAVVMTGYGSKAVAIEALREGADDFLEKPLSAEVLIRAVERAWRVGSRERENAALLVELQRTNAELVRANEELAAMASFADLDPAPLLRVGEDGIIPRGNPAAAVLASGESVVGRELGEVIPELADLAIEPLIARGEIAVREMRIGGREFQLALRGVPALEIAHVYGSDITELNRTRAQLSHSQRLDAVGQLAGGVAHDFNNLLTVVLLAAECLLEQEKDPDQAVIASEIIEAARKGAHLTRQLLAFGRKQVLSPSVVRLDEVVRQLRPLLGRTMGEQITVEVSTEAEAGPVFIDRGQIEQVILNLAVNARDALARGGRLRLETRSASPEELARVFPEATPGRYVLLAVSDNGCGMSREVRDRAFEPFFTTKEPGAGTGLGLAAAYGVVRGAGGAIVIDSQLGGGTTVTLCLPVTDRRPPAAPAADPSEDPRGSGETVLVVDDDDDVRRVAVRMLASGGYRVLSARSASEALEALAPGMAPLHLLLADVIMPGMLGTELAVEVKRAHPGVKIVLMSGYMDDVLARHGIPESARLLAKPFTRSRLLRAIRTALEARCAA